MLTGALTKLDQLSPDDWRLTTPRFQAEAFPRNLALVEAVKAMAAKKGCAPGQLALAWVHAQGDDVFPIPGTKRVKYLEENAGGVDVKARRPAPPLASFPAQRAQRQGWGGAGDEEALRGLEAANALHRSFFRALANMPLLPSP